MNGNNEPRKRPTQSDVARLAGVTQTTVSQVIRNSGTIAVPAETRRRIFDAIEELGYVPDITARSLRTRKTYTIASIIPDITNPFYPAVERGIQDVAEVYDYNLIVYNTDGVVEKERKCLRAVLEGRVDGVIVSLFHLTATDLRPLLERHVPVVRLESHAQAPGHLPLDNLYVDSAGGARLAVNYLIERLYSPIAFVGSTGGPGPLRRLGYQNALIEHGLPYDESLIVEADFTEAGGYNAMRVLLSRHPQPRAVFAANDLMAMGVLAALREAHLRVPEDIAVIGYDDIPAAKHVCPSLTTIGLFQEQIGRRAAELLFERLQGTFAEAGRSIEMPFRLVKRESA